MSKLKTMCAMIFQDTVHVGIMFTLNLSPFSIGLSTQDAGVKRKSRSIRNPVQTVPKDKEAPCQHIALFISHSLSLSRSLSVVDFRQRRRNKKKLRTPRLQKLTNIAQRTRKWRKS